MKMKLFYMQLLELIKKFLVDMGKGISCWLWANSSYPALELCLGLLFWLI